jgi:hypothetical protein
MNEGEDIAIVESLAWREGVHERRKPQMWVHVMDDARQSADAYRTLTSKI